MWIRDYNTSILLSLNTLINIQTNENVPDLAKWLIYLSVPSLDVNEKIKIQQIKCFFKKQVRKKTNYIILLNTWAGKIQHQIIQVDKRCISVDIVGYQQAISWHYT